MTHGGSVVSASGTITIHGKHVPCRCLGHLSDSRTLLIEGDMRWLEDGGAVALSSGKRTERFSEHFIRKDRAIGDAVSTFAYGIETRAGKYHDQIDEDGATVKGYSESPISVRLIDAIASGRWTALCQADAATKRSSAVRQEIR